VSLSAPAPAPPAPTIRIRIVRVSDCRLYVAAVPLASRLIFGSSPLTVGDVIVGVLIVGLVSVLFVIVCVVVRPTTVKSSSGSVTVLVVPVVFAEMSNAALIVSSVASKNGTVVSMPLFEILLRPRLVLAPLAVDDPVPPATTGRAVFASVTRSSMVLLYFELSMVVFGEAVVPDGLLYTFEPSRGIRCPPMQETALKGGLDVVSSLFRLETGAEMRNYWRMTLMDIAGGVLVGNLLTVWFVWGVYHFAKRTEEDVPWIAYGSVLAPLGIAILSLIGAGAMPG